MRELGWMDRAACRGQDRELWSRRQEGEPVATVVRYSREQLEQQRALIEGRRTLRDLQDIALLRDLTGDEYTDLVELQRIAFLLGDKPPDE